MKLKLLFIYVLLTQTIVYGAIDIIKNTNQLDSLAELLHSTNQDTLKARIYLEMSEILYQTDLDTVISLSEKSIEIIENNLSRNISETEHRSFLVSLAGAYNNIGFIYDDKGEVIKALEYYNKSLKIREKIGDKQGIAITLNNIGIIYLKQDLPHQALDYYLKSLKVKKEIGDKKSIAISLNNIAGVYKKIDLKKSLEYYTKALIIREEIDDRSGMAVTMNNIGTLYKSQNSLDTALQYYNKALQIRKEIGDKRGITNTYSNIGNIAFLQNKLTLAEKYGVKALNIAQQLGYIERIADAAKLLSQVYSKKSDWRNAFKMQNLFISINDSVKSQETELELIKQKAKYDLDKLKKEKELLLKEKSIQELVNNKNKILAITLSLSLVFVLIIVVVVYRNGKKKDIINQLLEKQKNEAEKKSEEKNNMLKEIHHRVKNSLQVISSLLRLQSYEFDDEYVRNKFEEALNRVISIARLHEQMYNSENLKEINVKKHFTPLIKELIKDYQVSTEIELKIDLIDFEMGSKTLIPLGLMINEIISNSLKYAFNNSDRGEISIKILHLNENKFLLEIGDNGVGMPEDFNFYESQSLGIQLIHVFAEQLNGEIELTNNNGTKYKITFENLEEDQ